MLETYADVFSAAAWTSRSATAEIGALGLSSEVFKPWRHSRWRTFSLLVQQIDASDARELQPHAIEATWENSALRHRWAQFCVGGGADALVR